MNLWINERGMMGSFLSVGLGQNTPPSLLAALHVKPSGLIGSPQIILETV